MFGYIRAVAPELRVRENEYYRAAYCGLCRSLGRCTGCTSRLTLNYDFVFAALVRMAIVGEMPEFERRRCAMHPFRRRPSIKTNKELEYAACAGILLSYYKLKDDISDERGRKRMAARIGAGAMRRMKKRAAREYRDAEGLISEGLDALSALEASRLPSVDMPADVFGKLMAGIMSYGLSGADARIAGEIGLHIGRWLYIIDAADDCAEDIEKGRYNPFFLLYGEAPDNARRADISNALKAELIKLEQAFDLIDRRERRDLFEIIENILHLGMPAAAERVLGKQSKGEDSERSV